MTKPSVGITNWIQDPDADYCWMRCYEGTDVNNIANRVAFIEKTPRVRVKPYSEVDDFKNWESGPKGQAPEYGAYQPSRDWCDARLAELYGATVFLPFVRVVFQSK